MRKRQVKNFATIHMLSMGVPMIVGGDEFMRSQGGNNNTYCHDNEINWYDWEQIASNQSQEMIRFWSLLIEKRKKYIDSFRGRYFTGQLNKFGLPDISWHGTQLYNPGWDNSDARCLSMTLGDVAEDTDQTGNVHIMFNMFWEAVEFEIPQIAGLVWYRSIDTALPAPQDIASHDQQVVIQGSKYLVSGRSIVTLVSRAST
jgi:glycogen operon protein